MQKILILDFGGQYNHLIARRVREGSPAVDKSIFTWGVPILGICYGCQLMAHLLGGEVVPAQDDSAREYGKTTTHYDTACKLFQGLPEYLVSRQPFPGPGLAIRILGEVTREKADRFRRDLGGVEEAYVRVMERLTNNL